MLINPVARASPHSFLCNLEKADVGLTVQGTRDAGGGLGRRGGGTFGVTAGRSLLGDSGEPGWGRAAPDARGAGKCIHPVLARAAPASRNAHCISKGMVCEASLTN